MDLPNLSRLQLPWGGEIPRSLTDFRREVDTLFDRFFKDEAGPGSVGGMTLVQPHMNVTESADAYEVSLELAGVGPDDFHVEVEEDVLRIYGEKREEQEFSDKTVHRVERRFGKFQRAIRLGQAVDHDKISADYTDGVLRVTVPKIATAKPRKVAVTKSQAADANVKVKRDAAPES